MVLEEEEEAERELVRQEEGEVEEQEQQLEVVRSSPVAQLGWTPPVDCSAVTDVVRNLDRRALHGRIDSSEHGDPNRK